MKAQIKSELDKIYDETIENMQKMIRIPSIRNLDSKTPSASFGSAIGEALDTFLTMAADIGMRTYRDPEGYYGYAEIGPKDAQMLGIIGHVDVVPIGEEKQWTIAKPFSAEIVDNCLIGRGSLDDKGPLVINLMAIKALQAAGVEFNKRIRIVVGCAEETTWECITKYAENEEMPNIAFSPDADFPVINAEKTIHQFDMRSTNLNADYTVISSGAYNSVADNVTYIGDSVSLITTELDKLGYEYSTKDNSLTVKGKSAHSMACHLGINAISRLAQAMVKAGITSPALQFINDKIANTSNGELICGDVKDNVSGKLTLNIGNIEIINGKEKVGFDTRIPVLIDHKDIIKKYQVAIEEYQGQYIPIKLQDKLYFDENSKLVSTLMEVYKDVTGDIEAKPLSSGGGTYSRAVDNCVAFGTVFSTFYMDDSMHQPNERFELKFLSQALEIYAQAIYLLQK